MIRGQLVLLCDTPDCPGAYEMKDPVELNQNHTTFRQTLAWLREQASHDGWCCRSSLRVGKKDLCPECKRRRDGLVTTDGRCGA